MRKLVICGACGRHVFLSESACPFCDARLPPSAGRRTLGAWPAVAAATAALGCGGNVGQDSSATLVQDASTVGEPIDASQIAPNPVDGSEGSNGSDGSEGSEGSDGDAVADAGADGDAGDLDASLFKDVILAVPYLARR